MWGCARRLAQHEVILTIPLHSHAGDELEAAEGKSMGWDDSYIHLETNKPRMTNCTKAVKTKKNTVVAITVPVKQAMLETEERHIVFLQVWLYLHIHTTQVNVQHLQTYSEKHKEALVVFPDTVVHPGTVVVHFANAALTDATTKKKQPWTTTFES